MVKGLNKRNKDEVTDLLFLEDKQKYLFFFAKKMFTQKMFTPNFDLNSLLPNSRVKFPR